MPTSQDFNDEASIAHGWQEACSNRCFKGMPRNYST